MKIVITNESGLTEHHIAQLEQLGTVESYTDTTKENVVERVKSADIAVIDCFITPVTKELLSQLPNLKFLTINSTGHDNVDSSAVNDAGVVASNVPGFSTEAVAEFAIGLMFATIRKIPEGDREFRESQIVVDPGTPEAVKYLGFNLRGRTLGVVGLGNIGSRVAEIGQGLGMLVIGYNRTPKEIDGVRLTSLEELFSVADVVSVNLSLNSGTAGLVTSALLSQMKKTAVIISIASMKIFDSSALREALNSNAIAGAALDTADSTFLTAKNTVLTPGMAYNTRESAENMGTIILANIQNYVAGTPINKISQ